jgi:hypothetical protein
MDHDLIVEQLLDRCKCFIERSLQAVELHSVAAASLAIWEHMRDVARAVLQAKVELEAQQCRHHALPPGCPEAEVTYVHPRTVSPRTLFGAITIPVRTFQGTGCGSSLRPDDTVLGVPERGEFTDDVRLLYTPLVAELPHRVANDFLRRVTGLELSSCGAQGIIDSSAADHAQWRTDTDAQADATVAEPLEAGENAHSLHLEIAMDGVKAHIDGRWQAPKVATILVRRLPVEAQEPTRGTVVARRYLCILGSAEALVTRLKAMIRDAGWAQLPVAEILGDGAPWIWHVAEAHFPGVRQTLDYYHLSEHLDAVAQRLFPEAPEHAKQWVEGKQAACLTDHVGDVLGGLRRLRPSLPAVQQAVTPLLGYVETNRTHIRYQEPWHSGLAVGSGSVEGACKHVVQARFKRAGMRWTTQGFLHVLELRLARLNGTLPTFWASRGLAA